MHGRPMLWCSTVLDHTCRAIDIDTASHRPVDFPQRRPCCWPSCWLGPPPWRLCRPHRRSIRVSGPGPGPGGWPIHHVSVLRAAVSVMLHCVSPQCTTVRKRPAVGSQGPVRSPGASCTDGLIPCQVPRPVCVAGLSVITNLLHRRWGADWPSTHVKSIGTPSSQHITALLQVLTPDKTSCHQARGTPAMASPKMRQDAHISKARVLSKGPALVSSQFPRIALPAHVCPHRAPGQAPQQLTPAAPRHGSKNDLYFGSIDTGQLFTGLQLKAICSCVLPSHFACISFVYGVSCLLAAGLPQPPTAPPLRSPPRHPARLPAPCPPAPSTLTPQCPCVPNLSQYRSHPPTVIVNGEPMRDTVSEKELQQVPTNTCRNQGEVSVVGGWRLGTRGKSVVGGWEPVERRRAVFGGCERVGGWWLVASGQPVASPSVSHLRVGQQADGGEAVDVC